MEWFDENRDEAGNLDWFRNSYGEITQEEGFAGKITPGTELPNGLWSIDESKTKHSGSKMTGVFVRTWDQETTDIRRKGIAINGKIGVYYQNDYKEKTSMRSVTTGPRAEPGPKVTNGSKKTWTGPTVEIEDEELRVTAGGNTQWQKYVN